MRVVGTFREEGLGLVSWWTNCDLEADVAVDEIICEDEEVNLDSASNLVTTTNQDVSEYEKLVKLDNTIENDKELVIAMEEEYEEEPEEVEIDFSNVVEDEDLGDDFG